MKSIFRYPGGKTKVAQKLLSFFPASYKEYREACVGGGGVFFAIEPSVSRWINDLDDGLISVYNALQRRPEAFIKSCRELINIPEEKDEKYVENLKIIFDRMCNDKTIDLALRYFFINRTVWEGRVTFNIPSRLYFSNPEGWNIVETNKLEKSAKIIKDVNITRFDCRLLLNKPGNDVFVYIDPPYVKNSNLSRTSRLYAHNFEINDHTLLRDAVKSSKHKVMISYDDCGLIRDLYKDFYIYELEWKYCGSSLKKKETGKELVITNYPVNILKEQMIF